MSDVNQDAARQGNELFVPASAKPEASAKDERPLLSVTLGNVVLTEHGAEVTLVFPKEVVFADDELSARLEEIPDAGPSA